MLEVLDSVLISLYQLSGYAILDYFLGTFLLALLTVLVGQGTIAMVYRYKRNHLEKLSEQLARLNRMAAEAMERGDRQNYKILNKEASDTYGHLFFNRFGLSAAFLWPAFFALAWMQQRFQEIVIPVPFIGTGANYFVVFLICYVMARIVFSRVKKIYHSWRPGNLYGLDAST